MRTIIAIWVMTSFISCKQKQAAVEKLDAGTEYKMHEQGSGENVRTGNWLKLQVVQLYNDSVLNDTRRTGPVYQKYDSATMSKESLAVFKNVKAGDSLEFKVSADSAFKNNRPAFAKAGGWLVTRVKVEKILPTEDAYQDERRSDTILHKK